MSLGSLDAPTGNPLIENTEWAAQYVAPGYLLFLRGATLMAQPFDLDRLTDTATQSPLPMTSE